jgi:hypothetical protein
MRKEKPLQIYFEKLLKSIIYIYMYEFYIALYALFIRK